jgi:predicted MFS family arabinose efflux permease
MSDRTYKWAVVAMLWLVCFFNYADRQSIYSVFPMLQKDADLQLTTVQLGYVASSFMWVYAGAGWLAGLVGDRFRRKTVVLGGFLFWSLVTLAFSFATKYSHIVALRAIEGFGEAFYFPAAMALISAYHGKDTRSRAMGIHQSSVYIGTVAGGTLGGAMGQHFGWRSSFTLLGLVGMVFCLLLFLCLKEPPEQSRAESRRKESLGEILKTIGDVYRVPMGWVLTGVFVGANFVAMVFLVWLPKFLVDKFDMSLSMAGFSATAYLQVASVLGVLCGGVLADRMARRYRGGRMMTQTLGLFCGVPFIFIVGWTLHVPLLIPAMACFGLFKGLYDSNIWASLHDVVPPERRATAVGVVNSVGWLGAGTATVTIAAASQWFGMSTCISATSLIYLFLAVVLAWGISRFMSGKVVPAASAGSTISAAE